MICKRYGRLRRHAQFPDQKAESPLDISSKRRRASVTPLPWLEDHPIRGLVKRLRHPKKARECAFG
jgi:hypothetical protein